MKENEAEVVFKQAAEQVRKVIDAAQKNQRTIGMMAFPLGACGDCSYILGTYLIDMGYQDAEYVVGMRGKNSHAWVECKGVILDITADQFGENPVIVTQDRSWHDEFEDQRRHSANFRDVTGSTIHQLHTFLDHIYKVEKGGAK